MYLLAQVSYVPACQKEKKDAYCYKLLRTVSDSIPLIITHRLQTEHFGLLHFTINILHSLWFDHNQVATHTLIER